MNAHPSHLFLLPLIALGLGAASCVDDGGALGRAAPRAELSPAELDLGEVPLGVTASGLFSLENAGNRTLTATAVQIDGETVFELASELPVEVAPSASDGLELRGTPTELRRYRARILVHSDGGLQQAVVTMTGVEQPDCEDGNPCTVGTFDPSQNRCLTSFADGTPCQPADACIIDAVCSQGVCLGRSKTCDDGSVCTEDLCRQSDGECVFFEDSSACDDDNPCTADGCAEEGCFHEPLPNGTACDDRDECTLNDACFAGVCRGATLPDGESCDDDDSCTIRDRCEAGRCTGDSIVEPAQEGDIVFSYPLRQWDQRAFLHRREVSLSDDGVLVGLDHLSTNGQTGLIHVVFAMEQCGTEAHPAFTYRPADSQSWVQFVRRAVMIDQRDRTRLIVGVRQLPENGFRPETTSYFIDDDGEIISSAIRTLGGETGWSLTPDGSFTWGVVLPTSDGPPPPGEASRDVLTIAREDRDGAILWRYDRATTNWAEFLGVAGPRVLYWSNGRFGALDFATGAPVWSQPTPFIPKEMALSTQLDLGVARAGRQIIAVRLLSGEEVFRFPPEASRDYIPRTDPVISSDGRIILLMERRLPGTDIPTDLSFVEVDTNGRVIGERILPYTYPADPTDARHEDFNDDPYPTVADDGVTYVGYGDRFWAIEPGGEIRWTLTSTVNGFSGTVPLLRDDGILLISRGSREIIGVRTNGAGMDVQAWSSFRNDARRTNYTP
jgi:hypothetical protein